MLVWIPNHLNKELLIVWYSNVSIIWMFAIQIPTVPNMLEIKMIGILNRIKNQIFLFKIWILKHQKTMLKSSVFECNKKFWKMSGLLLL